MQLLYRPIKWSLDTESDFMESVVGNSKNLFDTKTLNNIKCRFSIQSKSSIQLPSSSYR